VGYEYPKHQKSFAVSVTLKILQVYPNFRSIRGGVERYIEGLSKYLSRKGHTVRILTLEKEHFEFVGEGSNVEKPTRLGLLRTAIFEDFDVVHAHGFRVIYSSLMGLLRKVEGDRVVMTVHTIYPKRSTFDGILKNFYDLTIGNAMLRSFDSFVAINRHVEQGLRNRGVPKDKIRVIPNSVDLERFENTPSPKHFLERVGLSSGTEIVLVVGRIDWQMGFDDIMKTFAEIHKDYENAKLLIIGRDYGLQNHLKELGRQYGVDSDVVFAGELTDRTLHSAYASAKVLLMTPLYEVGWNVLLEAMASGLPVVSTRIKGSSEMIANYDGVVWCEKKQLTKRLAEILSNETLRKDLSARGKEIVRRNFDWNNNADKILSVYRRA
jgi:glycosyltransferase involved in cell wall biosynthesis